MKALIFCMGIPFRWFSWFEPLNYTKVELCFQDVIKNKEKSIENDSKLIEALDEMDKKEELSKMIPQNTAEQLINVLNEFIKKNNV